MPLQESTEKKAEEDRGKEEVHMKKQTTKKKNKKRVRDNTYRRMRSIKKQKCNTKAAEEPDEEETESEGDNKPRKCDNKVNISTAGLSPGRRMQVEVMNTIGNQIGKSIIVEDIHYLSRFVNTDLHDSKS